MGIEKRRRREWTSVRVSPLPLFPYRRRKDLFLFFLQKMVEMVCFRFPWERLSSGVEWVLFAKKGSPF